MDRRLAASERICNDLREQVHANEVINRLPTLIFSGPAVVNSAPLQSSGPRPGDRSTPAGAGAQARYDQPPAPGTDPRSPTGGGSGSAVTADQAEQQAGSAEQAEQQAAGEEPAHNQQRPADSYAGAVSAGQRRPAQPDSAGREAGPAAGARPAYQQEDVEATLITLLNSTFPGLNVRSDDIDRAHRTRGKIWCRFAKSSSGSVRDRIYNGRLGLRHNKGSEKLLCFRISHSLSSGDIH